MKILLTGAGGFIGRALLPALLANGHEITLLSRRPGAVPLPQNASEILADTGNWAAAVRGKSYDLCLHLAWIASPGIYLDSPENELLADATIALADTLFQSGLPHFLALGTCIEYAPGQTSPCSESDTPIAPQSPYGKAKERARAGIAAAARVHRRHYTWARLFYPYGLGEHANRIPSIFLRTLSAGQPLVLKTPDSVKDWIEIRDVVGALIHLAEAAPPQAEINLGTGRGIRIADLAETIAAISGADPRLVQSAEIPAADPHPFHVADSSKLAATGWQPQIPLFEGLSTLTLSPLSLKP